MEESTSKLDLKDNNMSPLTFKSEYESNFIEVPIEICSPYESSIESIQKSQEDTDDVVVEFESGRNSSSSSRSAPLRADPTAAERNRLYRKRHHDKINQRRREIRQRHKKATSNSKSSNSQIHRQRRYYERHRQEINKRKRDRRVKDMKLNVPRTAAERNRSYRERNRYKINERRKANRQRHNKQEIDTDSTAYVDTVDEIVNATAYQSSVESSNNIITQTVTGTLYENVETQLEAPIAGFQDSDKQKCLEIEMGPHTGIPTTVTVKVEEVEKSDSDDDTRKQEICHPNELGNETTINKSQSNKQESKVFIKQQPLEETGNPKNISQVDLVKENTIVSIKKEPHVPEPSNDEEFLKFYVVLHDSEKLTTLMKSEEIKEPLSDDTGFNHQFASTVKEENIEYNEESQGTSDSLKSKTREDENKLTKNDVQNAIQLVTDITKKLENHVTKKYDTFDYFGTYVASVLRGMPREKALNIQPRIIGLINSTQVFKTLDL